METMIAYMPTVTASDVMTGGPRQTPIVGASPWTWLNDLNKPATVVVSGGTVTSIHISRDGSVFDLVGLLAGIFLIGANDRLRITYAVAPTVSVYPL